MLIKYNEVIRKLINIRNMRKYSIYELNNHIEDLKNILNNDIIQQNGGNINIENYTKAIDNFQDKIKVLSTDDFKELLDELENLNEFFED